MLAQAQSKSAKFEVTSADSTLKLSFAISEEELNKVIAAQKKQLQSKPPAQTQPTITGQPPTVAPEKQTTSPGGTSVFTLPGPPKAN